MLLQKWRYSLSVLSALLCVSIFNVAFAFETGGHYVKMQNGELTGEVNLFSQQGMIGGDKGQQLTLNFASINKVKDREITYSYNALVNRGGPDNSVLVSSAVLVADGRVFFGLKSREDNAFLHRKYYSPFSVEKSTEMSIVDLGNGQIEVKANPGYTLAEGLEGIYSFEPTLNVINVPLAILALEYVDSFSGLLWLDTNSCQYIVDLSPDGMFYNIRAESYDGFDKMNVTVARNLGYIGMSDLQGARSWDLFKSKANEPKG